MFPAVIHVVRRFGQVGGMEKYVWQLVHQLVDLGVAAEVICEEVIGSPNRAIIIHEVDVAPNARRWKSMLNFRSTADQLILQEIARRPVIVHSHERCIHHHVTTFHGPPMFVKDNWWRFAGLSRRVSAWKEMERKELSGPLLQCVLPVSEMILKNLMALHPYVVSKRVVVAWPGVNADDQALSHVDRPNEILRLVFVGKEWKRKGLDIAVALAEAISEHRSVTLDVFGPDAEDIPMVLRSSPVVKLRGWVERVPWSQYHLLIHPARNEPFGMVVPEARLNGVPALISTATGSLALNFEGVEACGVDEPISTWFESLSDLIKKPDAYTAETRWTWQQLAKLHLHDIYPAIKLSNLSPTLKLK